MPPLKALTRNLSSTLPASGGFRYSLAQNHTTVLPASVVTGCSYLCVSQIFLCLSVMRIVQDDLISRSLNIFSFSKYAGSHIHRFQGDITFKGPPFSPLVLLINDANSAVYLSIRYDLGHLCGLFSSMDYKLSLLLSSPLPRFYEEQDPV